MTYIEWLNQLKVGDKVVIDKHYNGLSVDKVFRLTATQIIFTCGWKFRKSNGYLVGSTDSYSTPIIRMPTDSLIEKIMFEKCKKKLKEIANLPLTFKQIDAMLNAYVLCSES